MRDDLKIKPQLYNLDCAAYESLMLGMFTVWRGQPADRDVECSIRRTFVGGASILGDGVCADDILRNVARDACVDDVDDAADRR